MKSGLCVKTGLSATLGMLWALSHPPRDGFPELWVERPGQAVEGG